MATAPKRQHALPAERQAPAPVMDPREARFNAFVEQFKRPIYTYVLRLVRDTWLAEDITQESFVRLFRELDNIRDATASAWLYRVARNLVTDHRRKKSPVLFTVLKGNQTNDNGDHNDEVYVPSREDAPEDVGYAKELQASLASILDRMSPKFRDPLILCDVEKLTYEQASQVLGCSVKTVSARLHRAREFVATCLDKVLVDENASDIHKR